MPDSKSIPLHEVQLDIYIARRKRVHAIYDPSGVPVFHAPHISQVLAWLHEKGVASARFLDGETAYLVLFQPCTVQDNPEPGEPNG